LEKSKKNNSVIEDILAQENKFAKELNVILVKNLVDIMVK